MRNTLLQQPSTPIANPAANPAANLAGTLDRTAHLAGEFLPWVDFLLLFAAGTATSFACGRWAAPLGLAPGSTAECWQAVLVAALLAPFVLYDRSFGSAARHAHGAALLARHGLRFLAFGGVVALLGMATDMLSGVPGRWLGGWLLVALALTSAVRIAIAIGLRRRVAADAAGASAAGDPTFTCRVHGVEVRLVVDRPIRHWDAVAKAAEDLVLGSVATLLLLPVLALIALAIKLDSPGPVLFRQRRHAVDNDEFGILKFRTMSAAAAGAGTALVQTRRGDPRITRVGRILRATSLDELPQLFNVLRGEMSLVGPRPHAIDMRTEDRLGAEITDCYAHRHRVKPGMTGWSQVNGARGATDTQAQLLRRVQLDLHYIEHWSLWLDLRILVMTVREVLKGTNAF